jgi:predicted class III extradiol MEMO1 family dioxygenase
MTLVRTPAIAGQCYSGNAEELRAAVAAPLEEGQDRDTPAPKALIVPHAGYIYIVVGNASPELVSQVLDARRGGSETLIVISFSHCLKYDATRAIDSVTCTAIENLDAAQINHDMACGATQFGGLLIAARRRGMKVTTLDLRNSADTTGHRGLAVGYGAWMFV